VGEEVGLPMEEVEGAAVELRLAAEAEEVEEE